MIKDLVIHNGELEKNRDSIRFVCISDSHSQFIPLPAGDVLLHAGDFTRKGSREEVWEFANYLRNQDFQYKVVIAGNHDTPFDVENYTDIISKKRNPNPCDPFATKGLLRDVIYLEDSLAVVFGYKVWGTPWTEQHVKGAFTLKGREKISEKWQNIPTNIDILLSHSPPYNILDRTKDNRRVGSESLASAVLRISPRLHIFGHIHESRGVFHQNSITYINASICSNRYKPIYRAYVFDLPRISD